VRPVFAKILIANRGEIACRVTRTARRMGIATVAVYSDADARSRHVALADEAFRIGPPEAKDSYLRGDRILEAAMSSGASAIHPGYGFLAENAEFAERCERAGITFVGPPAEAIRAMGDKSAAKTMMERARGALVPGYHGGNQAREFLLDQALRIGFPVLIKAAAGGAQRHARGRARGAIRRGARACRREALSAFGDERVLLENTSTVPVTSRSRCSPTGTGGCIHLFERDCSVQRRHQKCWRKHLLRADRESPPRNGEAALLASRASATSGAGSGVHRRSRRRVLFHGDDTRLQVEHAVTEMVTASIGRMAASHRRGEKLPLARRICARRHRDRGARLRRGPRAATSFRLRAASCISRCPPESENVASIRGEIGATRSRSTTTHDRQLIVRDNDRRTALERMRKALGEFESRARRPISDFSGGSCRIGIFVRAIFDTGLIERNRSELLARRLRRARTPDVAVLSQLDAGWAGRPASGERFSPWSLARLAREPGGVRLFVFRRAKSGMR